MDSPTPKQSDYSSNLIKLANDFASLPDTSFLRPAEILRLRIVACSRATLYRMMAEGRFPRAHRLGRGMVGVRIGDIRQWLEDPSGWRVQNA